MIKETHLAVTENCDCGVSPDGIPMNKKGNPKVGHFPWKGDHDDETEVSYDIVLADQEDG